MTSIHSGYAINSPNVRSNDQIASGKAKPTEIPDKYHQQQWDFLEARYTAAPDTANHPAYQDYASVRVNGKVVARIDNNGFVETSNIIGSKLLGELPGAVNGKSGPMLAHAHAEKIAELLGGKVERSSTALTQGHYDSLPAPQSRVDTAAMKADPMFEQLQKSKQARSEFMTQQMAQDRSDGAGKTGAASKDAATEFLEYMNKTTEEKFFEAFLKRRGMTEEQFEQLPLEERTQILQEFKEEFESKNLEAVRKSMEETA